MPTRNVVLTDRHEEIIESLVRSGRYQNASEVLRDGLRLVEQREAEDAERLKALRAAARKGIAAVEHGDYTTFESATDLASHMRAVARRVLARHKA